ncbi:M14 family zinc carboxypeptidase [Streptomyces albus]|nr:M14 family zinc carboxypeptidase [Streptomyces albus]
MKLNRLTSNAELAAELGTLAKRHPHTLDVETIGRSVDGRPLYTATAGTGPRKLLILTQMHGDEPLGTEAALRMLKKVAGPGRAARELREEVTIKVVPRVNPDGWERYHDPDFREGIDPRLNSHQVDLNRMFGPAPEYDLALAPEAAAVHGVVDGFAPDLVLDYHHQVTYATPDGRMVTMSVLWSTHPDVAPEVAADGKRAAAVVGDALADDPAPTSPSTRAATPPPPPATAWAWTATDAPPGTARPAGGLPEGRGPADPGGPDGHGVHRRIAGGRLLRHRRPGPRRPAAGARRQGRPALLIPVRSGRTARYRAPSSASAPSVSRYTVHSSCGRAPSAS